MAERDGLPFQVALYETEKMVICKTEICRSFAALYPTPMMLSALSADQNPWSRSREKGNYSSQIHTSSHAATARHAHPSLTLHFLHMKSFTPSAIVVLIALEPRCKTFMSHNDLTRERPT